MASAAGVKDNSGICGLILIAAPGRKIGDVLREQLKANPANFIILKDAMAIIDQLESGERIDVSKSHNALQSLFHPTIQDFLISLMAVDPVDLLKQTDLPTLILQGDHDIQIGLVDAEKLKETGADMIVLSGVNHVLKNTAKGRLQNYASYSNPDLPLADSVVPPIQDFIQKN